MAKQQIAAIVFGVSFGMALAAPAPAFAQQAAPVAAPNVQIGPLVTRLDRIERDLSILQRQVYRNQVTANKTSQAAQPLMPVAGGQQGGAVVDDEVVSRMNQQLGELDRSMRNMNGQLEELAYQINGVTGRLDRLVKDVDFRLSQIEQANGLTRPDTAEDNKAETNVSDKPSKTTAKPVTTEDNTAGDAKERYRAAYSLLMKADYEGAQQALEAFLSDFPSDHLAGNAQYWLGETFYVRGDYERAAVAFGKGYEKYGKEAKGADSLLKLGLSMKSLDKKKEACTAFTNLVKAFPKASSTVKRRATAEAKKLGCK